LDHADVLVDMFGGSVAYDGESGLEGVKFSFASSAKASVGGFNSLDDRDRDGVLGRPSGNEPKPDTALIPPITLNLEKAWLKYRFEAKMKVSVDAAFSPGKAKIDNRVNAVFADYHIHARDKNTREAVREDLTKLRLAAVPDDILSLGRGEGLSYQVTGELTASVTLSWADVLSANLSALSRLIPTRKLIALEFNPGASVAFEVGVTDDFRVIFTRERAHQTLVSIKKAQSSKTGATTSLGIEVKLAEPAVLEEACNTVIKSLVGNSVEEIDRVLARASLDSLAPNERRVLEALVKLLGLGEVLSTIAAIRDSWDDFKKKVLGTVRTIASVRVSAGFKYEYSRLDVDESLLQIVLEPDELRAFHRDLMLGELRPLLGWAEEHPKAVRRYLRQTALERRQAWGFTLGIGKLKIGGEDQKTIKSIRQEDLNGNLKIAYNGIRSYTGRGLRDTDAWVADFKADMANFSASPTACDFQYGLHLRFNWRESKLTRKNIDPYLDAAAIWRVLSLDQADEAVARLKAGLDKKAEISLEIKINDLREVLPLLAGADDDAIAKALALAMPYMRDYAGRANPKFRELLYAGLWKMCLEDESMDVARVPSIVARHVSDVCRIEHIPGGGGLALREGGSRSEPAYQDFNTFAGQLYFNSDAVVAGFAGVGRDYRRFRDGWKQLDRAVTARGPHGEIEEVFGKISSFFSQSLYMRATGALLVNLALNDRDLMGRVDRAMTVTIGNKAMIFASSDAP
jgi:hypothetical protein